MADGGFGVCEFARNCGKVASWLVGGAALNKGQRRGGADPAAPSVPHSGREVASSQRRRSLGGKKNGVAGAIFNVAGVMFKAEKETKKSRTSG